MLDRLDLTELVIRRVDLNRVAQELDVEAVLDRLDLTELVIRRVDLNRVAQELDVEAVLDRLDLTELVIRGSTSTGSPRPSTSRRCWTGWI